MIPSKTRCCISCCDCSIRVVWICNSITVLMYVVQEKRIYDLKKKNQELEKFKFVLDYKIKELKRQMEPRENEIKEMKEQIRKVQRP